MTSFIPPESPSSSKMMPLPQETPRRGRVFPFPPKKTTSFVDTTLKQLVDELLKKALLAERDALICPPSVLLSPTFFNVESATPITPIAAAFLQEMSLHIETTLSQGKQETWFIVPFSASENVMAGSSIHICLEEYDTAPRSYNISFAASPEVVSFLQMHMPYLRDALQTRKETFLVNRIETHLEEGFLPSQKTKKVRNVKNDSSFF
jgi:hypothetical protein